MGDTMLFLKHTPAAPLQDLVEYLWLVTDAPSHGRERILPTGTLELVINLDEDRIRTYDGEGGRRGFSGSVLSGAYGRPFVIDTAEHALAMGVHFRCGGAFPFTRGTAPGEFSSEHVDLKLLWGPRAGLLRERLCGAGSHRERFELLERELVDVCDERRCSGRIQLAARHLGAGQRVRDVAAGSGFSHRHFVSRFREATGMTPKLFSRVHRFQRALRAARERAVSWAEIAAGCGYYDQAHLIGEFVEFAGCSPSELVDARNQPVKDHHLAL